jgi:hypothetical protein
MKRKCLAVGIILLFLTINIIPIVSCFSIEKHTSIIGLVKELNTTTKTESRGINVTLHGTKGENGWYISPVSIVITADNGTQIIDVLYSINGGTWMQYTAPFIITTDGWISLEVNALDQYGNWWYFSFSFGIDMSPPTIILQKEKMFLNKIKIIANVSDIPSGVWRVEFYLDDELNFIDYDFPFEWIWTGTGNHTVTAKVFDRAGLTANSSITIPYVQSQNQNYLFIHRMNQLIHNLILHHQIIIEIIPEILEYNQ